MRVRVMRSDRPSGASGLKLTDSEDAYPWVGSRGGDLSSRIVGIGDGRVAAAHVGLTAAPHNL